ncbi:GDSL-type esterase/lipase family protein [Reinekea sp.]|jgi:acyl-CoA thioesterase-1|uniref:GDSL-type esterase/lipase family protein n=1 Tax=Reinekea sp. TaxID=1970455 RepID=UPI00398A2D78
MENETEINICALGDGFVKGVGDAHNLGWAGRLIAEVTLEHGLVNYYNLGIPGETSLEVSKRIKELVPRMTKGADNRLILSFGVEDTVQVDNKTVVSNQESIEALTQLISQTRRHFKIMVVGLAPVYDPQRNNRIRRLNSLFRELCSKNRIPFVDIYTSLSENVEYKRALAKGDKIHPQDSGYEKIYDLISNDRAWWFS